MAEDDPECWSQSSLAKVRNSTIPIVPLRRRRPSQPDVWHLAEVVISIAGRKHWALAGR